MAPDYPDSARDLGLGPVTVLVEVTVSPSGALTDANVYKSSGNSAIDREALRAAHQSTYAPKLVNCSPTSGQYLFRAEFNPD
jgi:TonB family protein